MDAGADGPAEFDTGLRRIHRRTRRRALAASIGAVALLVAIAWSERGDIADHEIGALLRTAGIPARYHIESIGLGRQVITDVVVGDPAHPDLTIDRVITSAGLNGGAPALDRLTLINPRLHGSWRGGRLSFGSLDKLLNGPSTGPFRLPAMVLRVDNGRGEIVGDAGVIGLGLNGAGALRDGFHGAVVAVARRLDASGCSAADVKLSGDVDIADERPRLRGPLRLASLRCAKTGVRSGKIILPLDLTADPAFDGGEGQVGWSVNDLGIAAVRAADWQGQTKLTLRGAAVTAHFSASLHGLQGGGFAAGSLGGEGQLRSDARAEHITAEGSLGGTGLTLDTATWRALEQARLAAANSPAGPLLTRIAQVLARETPGSRLTGRFMLHRSGATGSLFLPELRLTGSSGTPLLVVSRGAAIAGEPSGLRFSGGFATGGQLPVIAGAITRAGDGLSLTMANYRVGAAAAAVPRLNLAMSGGTLTIGGAATLSGPLPNGVVQNLRLPIAGSWNSRGWKLWPGCTRIAFDRLAFASLTLQNDTLTICPRPGAAVVQSDVRGTGIAAGVPTFDLAGALGGAPIHVAGGPLGIAFRPGSPGTLVAKAVAVSLGDGQGASHFSLGDVDASLGSTIGGHFSGGDVDLAAVPLNLRQLDGGWHYDRGVLTIADAAFRVEDRERSARFAPLVAQGGALKLAGDVITAQAVLREPQSRRAITRLAIRHDLSSGNGHADLVVDGISFDKRLQPEALSALVLGIIADVRGTVAGQGTIDWADGAGGGKGVTSRGRFATDSLDLAAAFGPVKGLSGALTFTDLLGLVSASDQQLKIAAINPGVEIDDGVLTYALLPGHVLAINGATWPFLDGHLRLAPTRMTLGVSEVRRYEMRVDGVDAAKFLVRMNMSNLAATGLFDGGLPLVFDQAGGKVVGGMLTSRPPGGSVSYVGALSYKDLSPMANYAFETLKSLNYKQLNIGLDGSLSGDIFTRVSMHGVTQGPGAKRNFLTRQIGKLPLQFNVNIHAPFYMLMTNFKSLYDASYLPDPRTLGLLSADGQPIAHPQPPAAAAPGGVQPSVSETKP